MLQHKSKVNDHFVYSSCLLARVWNSIIGDWCIRKAAVCDWGEAAVLFNLILRLLSNVILMIRNGCLPKLGHLQSKVKQTAWEFGNAHIEILVNREGGPAHTFIHTFIPCGGCTHARTRTHKHIHTSVRFHHWRWHDNWRRSDDIMYSDCPQVHIGVFRLCALRQIHLLKSLKSPSWPLKVLPWSRIKSRLFFTLNNVTINPVKRLIPIRHNVGSQHVCKSFRVLCCDARHFCLDCWRGITCSYFFIQWIGIGMAWKHAGIWLCY